MQLGRARRPSHSCVLTTFQRLVCAYGNLRPALGNRSPCRREASGLPSRLGRVGGKARLPGRLRGVSEHAPHAALPRGAPRGAPCRAGVQAGLRNPLSPTFCPFAPARLRQTSAIAVLCGSFTRSAAATGHCCRVALEFPCRCPDRSPIYHRARALPLPCSRLCQVR